MFSGDGGGFGGHGLVSDRPVYSSYGYGRWKRSAEAEPVAEADPSRFGYGYGSNGHVSYRPTYSSYGYGRWKSSAEAEPGFSFGRGFGGYGRFEGYRGYGGYGGSLGGHGRFHG
ncbi:keratin-associated protein 19-2-like [Penaeus chinensis]|uniref:keratin-associated protein 19-2-like n=1 Tax=Penaeus chinensis TaxID=139456 RepID=UPI001FB596ED|nr:keratin-associated protein 19-2-like [Penaeus chinensis]